jgi:hypothetical protein
MPAAVVHTAEAPPAGTRLPSLTAADGPWVNRRGEVLWREVGDGPNGPATRQRLVLRGTDGAETEIAVADAPERFVGADLGAGWAVYSVGRPDSPAVRINASEIAGERERVPSASAVAGRSRITTNPELATPRIDGRLVVWHERVDTPPGPATAFAPWSSQLDGHAGSLRCGTAGRSAASSPPRTSRAAWSPPVSRTSRSRWGRTTTRGEAIGGVTLTAVPGARSATR